MIRRHAVTSRQVPCTWLACLVEETEAHVLILVLLLLSGGSLSSSRGSSVTASGSSRSSSSIGIGVGNAVLELLNLGPRVLGLDGDSEDLLVSVDDGVHDRGQGGVVEGQGDGGDGTDGAAEGLEQLLLADVENVGGEGVALVVDLLDGQTVGERRDVEQVEQGSLGGTDLGSSLNELEVGGNFNGTTSNLGGDTEGLEERGLSGLHTGVASGHPHIGGGKGTRTSGGGDLVVENLVTDGLEVGVGEDEADVALDERQEALVLGGVGDEGLESTTNLFGGG